MCERCQCAFAEAPPLPAAVRPAVALGAHRGALRRCVLALKYRDAPAVAAALAPALAAAVDAAGLASAGGVVPAPTTPARVRRRGYDPASVLAAALAAELGVQTQSLLVRRPGPPQQDAATRRERTSPQPFRFDVTGEVPTGCLVVDDVVTTGATLGAARRVLAAHGCAVAVAVLSVARIGPGSAGSSDPQ